MSIKPIKIAIIDMYDDTSNLGMTCIVAIINAWSKKKDIEMQYQIFPLRHKGEIPDHSFDIYLSTGGPGSPIDSVGSPWDNLYVKWLQDMLSQQKPVLLICHSFQIACRHFNFGNVCLRKSTQIGVLPVHPLADDPIFANLDDPNTFHQIFHRKLFDILGLTLLIELGQLRELIHDTMLNKDSSLIHRILD